MGRKATVSFETKIDIVKRYLAGKTSIGQEARRIGISKLNISVWISLYKSLGTNGLITTSKNSDYSPEIKRLAALDYLDGQGSYRKICDKYRIRSTTQLQNWVLKYNGHEKLKSSGSGGIIIMTNGRKTTFDERVEIVQYCIAHNHNYSETTGKYGLSYQQARSYTVKYESDGVEALKDNRGQRKSVAQMTEIERLRAENKILRTEKERAEMETRFLKNSKK